MTQGPSNSVSKAIAASITSFVLDMYRPYTQTVDRAVLEGSVQALINVALERDVTKIGDAEIRAACEVMLEPQSCVHFDAQGVRTYKTFDELDQIGQMELYAQVANALHAAEKERFR